MKHLCGSISYLEPGILFSNPQFPRRSIIHLDGDVLHHLWYFKFELHDSF